MSNEQKIPGLTGNQLKILAMIAMTCDHVGLELLPGIPLLRILGRLALPIYAYMIAEGCRYTRSRGTYLARLAGLAALCQMVYFAAMRFLYMCILVTFSLSVCLIWTLDHFRKKRTFFAGILAFFVSISIYALCCILPEFLPGFWIDYGFWGVLLPVGVYFGKTRSARLVLLALGLLLLARELGSIQWLALAALPILALYNGRRGNANIGKLFYWYYPAHLAVIYGISLLV